MPPSADAPEGKRTACYDIEVEVVSGKKCDVTSVSMLCVHRTTHSRALCIHFSCPTRTSRRLLTLMQRLVFTLKNHKSLLIFYRSKTQWNRSTTSSFRESSTWAFPTTHKNLSMNGLPRKAETSRYPIIMLGCMSCGMWSR